MTNTERRPARGLARLLTAAGIALAAIALAACSPRADNGAPTPAPDASPTAAAAGPAASATPAPSAAPAPSATPVVAPVRGRISGGAPGGGTIPVPPTREPVVAATGADYQGPPDPASFKPYLLFNQRYVEGLVSDGSLDITDADSVFAYIWSRLPAEVTVYPSENYYYFILNVAGTQYWGNIRLPAGRREHGVLSFAYFEFNEFPSYPGGGFSRAKYFTDADGVRISEVDPLTWDVRFDGKTVRFYLNELREDPPESFSLGPDEAFVERTFDESGLQFFLLFNTRANYFMWVLNEEAPVPETFEKAADDVLVGERTGFAFWVDAEHDSRKVLATIRAVSVTRNDYFDGPFDQLADNYANEIGISDWMVRALPALEGRIDNYGYYTDSARSSRVALSNYGTYYTRNDILQFVERAKASDDPYQFISRGGVPVAATLIPTPSPEDAGSGAGDDTAGDDTAAGEAAAGTVATPTP